jgi:predicted transcriptional regulator
MGSMATTIQISEDVRETLNQKKLHPRETYNDVIERLIEDSEELDEDTKKEIEAARAEIEAGRYKTHEQVKKEMGF